jgi:hypothetical protein
MPIRKGRIMAAVGRVVKVSMAMMLAIGALTVLPAVSASAAGSVQSWWTPTGGGSTYENTYNCTAYQYGVQGKPVQVDNNCGTRVWLHYHDTANGQIYAYCVDPGGGVAYDFGYPSADIQVTTNSSQCDSGSSFDIWWQSTSGPPVFEQSYSCSVGKVETKSGYLVVEAYNGCNTRMWLHEYANGTGGTLCMNDGETTGPYTAPYPYLQVQVSYNQVTCSAGGAPH